MEESMSAFDRVKSRLEAKKSSMPEDNMKDCEGPCRELATTMLRRKVEHLRRRADGLEALLFLLEDAPQKGDRDIAMKLAEEAVWDMAHEGLFRGM